MQYDHDLAHGRDDIILMLQKYGRGRKELIMMVQDFNQQERDELLMREIDEERNVDARNVEDAERNAVFRATITQELEEQRAHDHELSQLHDDVLQHINTDTDETIAAFDRMHFGRDDDSVRDSPINDYNCDF